MHWGGRGDGWWKGQRGLGVQGCSQDMGGAGGPGHSGDVLGMDAGRAQRAREGCRGAQRTEWGWTAGARAQRHTRVCSGGRKHSEGSHLSQKMFRQGLDSGGAGGLRRGSGGPISHREHAGRDGVWEDAGGLRVGSGGPTSRRRCAGRATPWGCSSGRGRCCRSGTVGQSAAPPGWRAHGGPWWLLSLGGTPQ